ncbi:putative peptide ABC transporter permease protein [Gordonia effusa NBRC 100432]|uniref:Putative peptide ABC transporter permease protein n=1 Tax=Gordonia effusa NBRC 100432 TaxID=1077974 RepID=H0QXL6_9ACTN|nr:ABC transporter permease [Gordonia effusa]GAB17567.1 putative peptide ABC transporter permease protein [Gordonia effusa NBRC 100432]
MTTTTPPSALHAMSSAGGAILRAVGTRLLAAFSVIAGAALIGFLALQLLPGDPVDRLLGANTSASPAVRAKIVEAYGFDQPLYVRLGTYGWHLLNGDLGQSYQLQEPVTEAIGAQLGPTLQLTAAALLIAVVWAYLSALISIHNPGGWARGLIEAWEVTVASAPPYWIGILLASAFSFRWRLFPIAAADGAAALVLPALTLALPISAVLAQVFRDALSGAMNLPFTMTARSRGLTEWQVVTRHVQRHAINPVITLAGWVTGSLLGGAIAVETVFGRPGLGALTLQAVSSGDVPVVIGVIMFSAVVFVAIALLCDAVYPIVDPRLRKAER